MRGLVAAVAFFVMAEANMANSADIARLEWGSFVVDSDSSNGWAEYKAVSSDDGRTITMTFPPLEAKADGSTEEANADVTGHYDVIQPVFEKFTTCTVTIQGHVIKSSAGLARLTVMIGGAENVIEWSAGLQISEKFTRTIDIALPAEGRLPDPLTVKVAAYAKKGEAAEGATYVSVDSLEISTIDRKIARN